MAARFPHFATAGAILLASMSFTTAASANVTPAASAPGPAAVTQVISATSATASATHRDAQLETNQIAMHAVLDDETPTVQISRRPGSLHSRYIGNA